LLDGILWTVADLARSNAQLGSGRTAARRLAPEIRPPRADEIRTRAARLEREGSGLGVLTIAGLASVAMVLAIAGYLALRGDSETTIVVERIIRAESNGNTQAKNSRSSATGSAQIIDQTWFEMIQKHKQDLLVGRSRSEVLELRGDPVLTREIVTRMVEGNARTLKKRGLPVNPGTLYLAHFAGSAGAVALLTSADHLDAAATMAAADASGKLSREQLVKANPFLATFTVGDLKSWANRKMRG
jgi:hypothetical protein